GSRTKSTIIIIYSYSSISANWIILFIHSMNATGTIYSIAAALIKRETGTRKAFSGICITGKEHLDVYTLH
ncbi:hypothetical protein L9F63_012077, partial [Diploptera punctata]